MHPVMEVVIAALLISGGAFALIGAIGLLRLPDFFSRLHAPTKATTLGVGAIVVASMLFFGIHQGHIGVIEILITVFLFLTAPVSANMMAKSAMHLGVDRIEETRGRPWEQ